MGVNLDLFLTDCDYAGRFAGGGPGGACTVLDDTGITQVHLNVAWPDAYGMHANVCTAHVHVPVRSSGQQW